MKYMEKIIILFLVVLFVSGCSKNESSYNRVNSGNAVDAVINEQIDNAETKNNNAEPENADTKTDVVTDAFTELPQETNTENSDGVDYDLTVMGSDMVYATIYQMMVEPDVYVGKTFRMDGTYSSSYYEKMEKYYHYCMIADAAACCAQGIEFVWDDGSHVYPDEYPEENTPIVIQGTFETYREDGDSILYCQLKDATMEVVNE
ncbi:hypothetical protein [Konateibacter massiliensis]|uniref:hypothetical protein n=1 Tax=Konateibacter massiliensis TaxID=2002841 RepID=UPI000C146438|nr:hypothetical protein [Konateibacter massiliensis]